MLDVQFGQASDFGKVRTNNEDAMGSFIPSSRQQARSHGYLFAVADGVGGMDLGEVASATAIAVMTEEFAKAQAGTMLISLLPRLIQHANAAVHDCTLDSEYRGKKMATTLVACALRYDQAIVSHVGDSRCYLVRNGKARQVTQDHTLVNEQRKMGLISDRRDRRLRLAACAHSLAGSGDVCFARIRLPSRCSPATCWCSAPTGCTTRCSEETIAEIVSQKKNMDEIARELVARAVEIDGGDNTTAQVIRVRVSRASGYVPGTALQAARLTMRKDLLESLLFRRLFPIE